MWYSAGRNPQTEAINKLSDPARREATDIPNDMAAFLGPIQGIADSPMQAPSFGFLPQVKPMLTRTHRECTSLK
jgi:hypothetical protein